MTNKSFAKTIFLKKKEEGEGGYLFALFKLNSLLMLERSFLGSMLLGL